jgi:hypothetical protein
MTKLNLSGNGITGAQAGKALGDAIAGNTVLKELDISGDEYYKCDVEFVKAFAVGLHDNGALTKLVLEDNKLATSEAGEALGEALKGNTVLKELDISSNNWNARSCEPQPDGPGFANAISKGLAGNGAMTSLSLASNGLGIEGAKIVAAFLPKCT